MAEAIVVTPAFIIGEAAKRIREHYENRLIDLYALPSSPYPEDVSEGEDVHIVAILKPPVNAIDEAEFAAQLATDLMNYGFLASMYAADPDEALARIARRKGVAL